MAQTWPAGPAPAVETAEPGKAPGRACPSPRVRHQTQKVTHWCPEPVSHQKLVRDFFASSWWGGMGGGVGQVAQMRKNASHSVKGNTYMSSIKIPEKR